MKFQQIIIIIHKKWNAPIWTRSPDLLRYFKECSETGPTSPTNISCLAHRMFGYCLAPVWFMLGSCLAHVRLMLGSCLASGVASPKKVGGPNHVSLLVSSKSYNIHTWGTPLYVKKTFQRICANPKRGLNRRGGGGVQTPHSPVATPLCLAHAWFMFVSCLAHVGLMLGLGRAHVWLMFGSCYRLMFGLYQARVWLMFGSCLAHVWLMFGSCLAHVWLMFGLCQTRVWLMFGSC